MVQGRIWLLGPYFELFPHKNNNNNNNNNSQEALTCACVAGKNLDQAKWLQKAAGCIIRGIINRSLLYLHYVLMQIIQHRQ